MAAIGDSDGVHQRQAIGKMQMSCLKRIGRRLTFSQHLDFASSLNVKYRLSTKPGGGNIFSNKARDLGTLLVVH